MGALRRKKAHRPAAPFALQVNALQAMSRQVFGFRLAMIALAAPSALLNASPGVGVRLVGTAVVVTFMVSYALLRDWERFGPLLLRHPTLLAVDTLLGSLLLVSAGPDTTLAYVSVCTPLLAGILYGWRGAACFASLQGLILLLVHTTLAARSGASVAERLLLPGFCVITGALGSALRGLMLRFGEATEALAETRARLAAAEAVAAERDRLAREMHDSLAKSLYGVALAAEALAAGAEQPVREQAESIAGAARRAAGESRDLLTDLRLGAGEELDVLDELASRTTDFATRTGLPTTYRATGERSAVPVPPFVARELLTIAAEALDNAHRHADASRVEVSAGVHGDVLRVTVHDDGKGLPPGTSLDALRRAGHFGLLGMSERAVALGARLRIGRGGPGTEVSVELRLPLRVGQFEKGAA
ncbi:two-component sensor histidine kinase [Streptomyces sp. V2]|uniref:sensor histidine kinase n=1 Tax=Streptomyces sp. V2 TaxID=1424099 RepID=UPI000D66E823|nr:histidine kinase [Streptomyces sp. V2]PWG14704.1 two-component sensor histidine kinase [Streptomyces sp. V2]